MRKVLLLLLFGWAFSACQKEETFTDKFGKGNTQIRQVEEKNLSPYAIFGDSSFVLMTEEERTGEHHIEIPNSDDHAEVDKMIFEAKTGLIYLINQEGEVLEKFSIDESSYAKFISVDPMAEKYPDTSPYAYVLNNPLKYTDPDGRLVVDGKGRIITTLIKKSSDSATGYTKEENGKSINVQIEYDYDEVNIYANDGTPILARRVTAVRTITTTIDNETGEYSIIPTNGSPSNIDCTTNCHGLTFTKGSLRIGDIEAGKLIIGDQHKEVSQELSDAAIFHNSNGEINHSASRNSNGTYNSNNSDEVSLFNTSFTIAKRGENIDDSKNKHIKLSSPKTLKTSLGKKSNGLRVITKPQQIQRFNQKLGKIK